MAKEEGHNGGAVALKRSPAELLAELVDIARSFKETTSPSDITEPRDWQITAAAGDLTIDLDVQFGYLYIPNCPRDITIYAGNRGAIIGSFKQGAFITIELPRQVGVTISYAAGSAAGYLSTIASARPLNIQAGEALATPGSGPSSLGKAEDSPHVSGDIGVEMLGVRNGSMTVLSSTDGDYTPIGVSSIGAVMASPLSTVAVGDTATSYQSFVVNAGLGVIGIGSSLYNGSLWERQRTPTTFKTAAATAAGSTAVWTPAAGKKFRLMRFKIQVTSNATLAAGAIETITLLDAATDMQLTHSVFIPAAAVATTPLMESGWIDLGNGILSSTINNALNISLSAALTGGQVRIIVCGTEE